MTDSNLSGDRSPFDATGRGRPVVLALSVLIVAGAAVAAWLLTRGAGDRGASADTASHNHAAPGGSAAAPVHLDEAAARRIGVTFAEATRGPLAFEVRTVGQVTWDETRTTAVAPRVEGWVERLFVNFTGQEVRPGDALLELYAPMLVAAQEELLLAARLLSEVATGTDDARRSAEDMLASARRRLMYWDVPAAEVERIERSGQVSRTITLRAKAHGVVVEKPVVEGQRVMAGETMYRLADPASVWVEGQLFEGDVPLVRMGQHASVEVQAWPGERWHGRVSYVYPDVDVATRTARVRVELPNQGRRLKPGMFATLGFDGIRREGVLTVPRSAVLVTGERSLVFLRAPDGLLVPTPVVTGATSGDRIEVVSGLDAGDQVVASATFLVDAESNLRAALGSMATPTRPSVPPAAPPGRSPPPDDHSQHGLAPAATGDTIRPRE